MKAGSTLFLKGVLVLLALIVLVLCLYALPLGIREDTIGFRPVLMGLYGPVIAFFIALYQAYLLLNYIDRNVAFSELSVKALKKIKYCAIAISVIFAALMPLIITVADKDDAPGAVALGLVFVFASIVVATFAAVLQKLIQSGIEIKSENDLTV